MKKRVLPVLLCAVLCGFSVCFAGCNGKDIRDLTDRLDQAEENLENAEHDNVSLVSDISALKASVAALKTTIQTLESTVETLRIAFNDSVSGNTALKTKLDRLTEDLDAAKVRVTLLENLATGGGEPHIYEVGVKGNDTFTFVNNGIKLFSVQINTYGAEPPASDSYMRGVITNFAMPYVALDNYFDVILVEKDNTNLYSAIGGTESKIPPITSIDFIKSFYVDLEETSISYILLGIPNQAPSIMSVIPYAKFRV